LDPMKMKIFLVSAMKSEIYGDVRTKYSARVFKNQGFSDRH